MPGVVGLLFLRGVGVFCCVECCWLVNSVENLLLVLGFAGLGVLVRLFCVDWCFRLRLECWLAGYGDCGVCICGDRFACCSCVCVVW